MRALDDLGSLLLFQPLTETETKETAILADQLE